MKNIFGIFRVLRIILMTICLFISVNPLKAQWTNSGPFGGYVECFHVSGTNIYAGSLFGGVYLSTNNGSSWKALNAGLTNYEVESVAFSGINLYAGTSGNGIFKSTNNGLNWTGIFENTSANYPQVLNLCAYGTYVFASVFSVPLNNTRFIRSSNNGANWSFLNSSFPPGTSFGFIAYSGTKLFISTSGGVYTSTNNGANWISNSTLPINNFVFSGSDIFACSSSSSPNIGGVYKTTNDGINWTRISNGIPNNTRIVDLTISGSNVFATSFDSVYRSTNYGLNWTAIISVNPSGWTHKLDAIGSTIFLGTSGPSEGASGRGIYISSNNGTNWSPANTGFSNTFMGKITTYGTKLFTNSVGSVFGGGLETFQSTDFGNSWNLLNDMILNGHRIELFGVSGTNLLAGARSGKIFLSSNAGLNWTEIFSTTSLGINSFVASGTNLFAGTNGGSVYLSTNNGLNWASFTGLPGQNLTLYGDSGPKIFAHYPPSTYYSANNGSNWTLITSPSTTGDFAFLDSNVFAGGDYGVARSTNNGSNWTFVNNGLTNLNIFTLATYGSNIFAGAINGSIFLSTNKGASWTSIDDGLLNPHLWDISVSGGYVFYSTRGSGVWRRPLSEIISVQNISTEIPVEYKLKQNYPNPFNPTTNIKFDIAKKSFVKLIIYNSLGKEVSTLVKEQLNAGSYQADWDASEFPSGVYFYKLETDNYIQTKTMMFLK